MAEKKGRSPKTKEPPEPDKKKKTLDRPSAGEDLLSLIIETGGVDRFSAQRKLGVDLNVVDEWADSLEKEGWIKIRDREIEESYYTPTKFSLKRIKALGGAEKEVKVGGKPEEKKTKVSLKSKTMVLLEVFHSVIHTINSNKFDLIVISLLASSLYPLWKFISNPNKEIKNFILAVALASIAVIAYNISWKKLKIKIIPQKIRSFSSIFKTKIRYAVMILSLILLIYFSGGIIFSRPEGKLFHYTGIVFCISTLLLFFQPKKTMLKTVAFYFGMMTFAYSILLILGYWSVVGVLTGQTGGVLIRFIDFFAAVVVVMILHINEDFFGIGVKSFGVPLQVKEKR